jgi:DNA-binding MarR family transcriptional regulator
MHLPDDLPAPSTARLRVALQVEVGLLTLAARLRQQWISRAAAIGLSTVQVKALLMMRPGEAEPMRNLASRLDYDASNLSTLVDKLERRGVVRRHADPTDRRVKALILTAEGERLRASFWRSHVEDLGPLAPLAEADLHTMESLLAVLGVLGESAQIGTVQVD